MTALVARPRRRSGQALVHTMTAVLVLACLLSPRAGAPAEPLRLHAAGSLRDAMTDIVAQFTRVTGIPVSARYGASGLLRERIERGEPGDVFASADVSNPQRLVAAGKARDVVVFTRNRLCAMGRSGIDVTPDTLLDLLLDPGIVVGTSTPGADPAGDYAWQLFARADDVRAGARGTLEAKARRLTGGREPSGIPASGRGVYTDIMTARAADVVLTYCTNAAVVRRNLPDVQVVVPPASLAVSADYGATAITGPRLADARALVAFLLSADAQAIFERHGFARVGAAETK